jgi:hypothetical protein
VAALQVRVNVICAELISTGCEPEAPALPLHEPDLVQALALVALQLKLEL